MTSGLRQRRPTPAALQEIAQSSGMPDHILREAYDVALERAVATGFTENKPGLLY